MASIQWNDDTRWLGAFLTGVARDPNAAAKDGSDYWRESSIGKATRNADSIAPRPDGRDQDSLVARLHRQVIGASDLKSAALGAIDELAASLGMSSDELRERHLNPLIGAIAEAVKREVIDPSDWIYFEWYGFIAAVELAKRNFELPSAESWQEIEAAVYERLGAPGYGGGYREAQSTSQMMSMIAGRETISDGSKEIPASEMYRRCAEGWLEQIGRRRGFAYTSDAIWAQAPEVLEKAPKKGVSPLRTTAARTEPRETAPLPASSPQQRAMVEEASRARTNPIWSPPSQSQTPTLDEHSIDLTQYAREGKLDPVVGREKEILRALQILGRRTKANPAFVGEPGVGKTALAEGVAQRIASGDVPERLAGKRVMMLDLGSVIAGTQYRGQLEERIKTIATELENDPNVILFIDEFHALLKVADGQLADQLKPRLARGKIKSMAATTIDEYRQHIEKDPALERRFGPIEVGPPDRAITKEILKSKAPLLEAHYDGVTISEEVLEAVLDAAEQINTRFSPDKETDIIEETCSRIEQERPLDQRAISGDDVFATAELMANFPIQRANEDEAARLLRMEEHLHHRVIGQDRAISEVSGAVRRARSGLKDAKRPIGSFLLLGPTGVGKTELARALAEFLFKDERAMTRIDMSEYQEKHTISRLLGAPPGYVGYEEGGQLTEAVRRRPYSVVLFDEVEKAHPEVFNALLQVLDDGHLTDGKGKRVDFKNTIIVMTSNLDPARVKTFFRPEFLNRLDGITEFDALTKENVEAIAPIQIRRVEELLLDQGFELEITPRAISFLAEKGFDPELGARPLKRAIQRELTTPLSDLLLSSTVKEGKVLVDVEEQGESLSLKLAA